MEAVVQDISHAGAVISCGAQQQAASELSPIEQVSAQAGEARKPHPSPKSIRLSQYVRKRNTMG